MAGIESDVRRLCEKRRDDWELAAGRVLDLIFQAISPSSDRNEGLLTSDRFAVQPQCRIKEADRASAKIRQKYPDLTISSVEELEDVIDDWAGIKFVCNTNSDVQALIGKITSTCRQGVDGFRFETETDEDGREQEKIDDYIKNPKTSGYRAYHAVTSISVPGYPTRRRVKVEIQVKTKLQDSWGSLSHENFYKNAESNSFHNEISRNMSDLLNVVDDLADRLAMQVQANRGSDNADQHTSATQPPSATEVVTVIHLDPRYALALGRSGKKGLIPAVAIRDLLVEEGRVAEGDYISVDDYLSDRQRLTVSCIEENGETFFIPTTLAKPSH